MYMIACANAVLDDHVAVFSASRAEYSVCVNVSEQRLLINGLSDSYACMLSRSVGVLMMYGSVETAKQKIDCCYGL